MMVKILTLTGDELEIDVEPNDTVLSVKCKLEEREGIPVDQQRLIYQGKKMRDEATLSFYKVYPGTTMHLVVALRGGRNQCLKIEHFGGHCEVQKDLFTI